MSTTVPTEGDGEGGGNGAGTGSGDGSGGGGFGGGDDGGSHKPQVFLQCLLCAFLWHRRSLHACPTLSAHGGELGAGDASDGEGEGDGGEGGGMGGGDGATATRAAVIKIHIEKGCV